PQISQAKSLLIGPSPIWPFMWVMREFALRNPPSPHKTHSRVLVEVSPFASKWCSLSFLFCANFFPHPSHSN
ncbi:hypothetical protein PENTCL1PPCAC_10931, partial [Pristionchus entomophagus]